MTSPGPLLAEIALFPYNFTPQGWMPCDGRLLPISSNSALYSLVGTRYGGDGRTTFGLPNLNGRAAVGAGDGPGLERYAEGQVGGQATVTLTTNDVPSHDHAGGAVAGSATTGNPVGAVPATGNVQLRNSSPTLHEPMAPVGGSQAHNNMQPSLVLQYCIAVTGLFPSRS